MLTNRQRLALSLIEYWVKETGKYPTYRRLANLLGSKHPQLAVAVVAQLQSRGFLTVEGRSFRFNSERLGLFQMFRLDELTGEFYAMGLHVVEFRPVVGSQKAESPALQRRALG